MKTTVINDGSFSFEGGVNSNVVPTITSELVKNGLNRNQVAWLDNASVRTGGILQRTGWQPLDTVADGNAIFQGGILYSPRDGANPFLIFLVGGELLVYNFDLGTLTSLGTLGGGFVTTDYAYFCQGEEFLVVQANDYTTLPWFYWWDGAHHLRQSLGLNTSTPSLSELPAAAAMEYYMGRLWYSRGQTYGAGDIVAGSSGTPNAPFYKRDAILKVTENPLCLAGDDFAVPATSGNIRALKYIANVNTQLGQGELYVFTRKAIYSMTVPVTRTDWIGSDTQNGAQQKVVQINNGAVNDRSVVHINGDLFYQSLEPAIRSVQASVRNFSQWGNVPISANENRALQFNDRSLMRFASGIEFDNRIWQAVLPKRTDKGQVVHQAILPLDFDIISSFQGGTAPQPPAWEGMYEGLDCLQLFTADFSGVQRAFQLAVSRVDGSIQLWEMTTNSRTENGDNRVSWYVEFPAYTWGKEMELKKLTGGELWVDKVFGEVIMEVYYRPDADPCWKNWFATQFCSSRNCAEDANNPVCYPVSPNYRENYKFPVVFPMPPAPCAAGGIRPSDIGYQFQVKVVIKGWCRIRGIILFAEMREREQFEGLTC